MPRRVCGGTRVEIFEAVAMGKAVGRVRWGRRRKAAPIVSGQDVLQTEGPEAFARAVRSLLKDPGRRQTLRLAGRRRVEDRYSRSQVAREFECHYEEVVARHAR